MHRAFLHAAFSALAALLAFITYVVRIIYLQRVFNRMQAAAAEQASASRSGPKKIKKVAIFHISIGSGHKRAAQALEAVLKEKDPTIEVQVMDMLDFSSDRNRESLCACRLLARAVRLHGNRSLYARVLCLQTP